MTTYVELCMPRTAELNEYNSQITAASVVGASLMAIDKVRFQEDGQGKKQAEMDCCLENYMRISRWGGLSHVVRIRSMVSSVHISPPPPRCHLCTLLSVGCTICMTSSVIDISSQRTRSFRIARHICMHITRLRSGSQVPTVAKDRALGLIVPGVSTLKRIAPGGFLRPYRTTGLPSPQ